MTINRTNITALSDKELKDLITSDKYDSRLFALSDSLRREYYGTEVFIRGLIEFTNICKNNCLYCGLRCDNTSLSRYRLSQNDILSACDEGYALGFRTFVLQGGEDTFYTDEYICRIVYAIKTRFPDCAVTLSIGEKSRKSYAAYLSAGATRYLLRHETADYAHYSRLHPASLSLENRKKCLFNLKELGFQTGAGFMVGSPYQTSENIVSDFRFLQELSPDMIGIGPFIPHSETPFAAFPQGSLSLTLRLLALLRIFFPYALIPATTALGTIHPEGREMGLRAGANVLMPNLSPPSVRRLYSLYDNKICTGEEAAECIACLKSRVDSVGYKIVANIGDVRRHNN